MMQNALQTTLILLLFMTSSCNQIDKKSVSTKYLKLLKQNLEDNNGFMNITAERNLETMYERYKRKVYITLYLEADTISNILDELIEQTTTLKQKLSKDMTKLQAIQGNWSFKTTDTNQLETVQNKLIEANKAANSKISNHLTRLKNQRKFGIKEKEIEALKSQTFLRENKIRAMFEPSIKQVDYEEFIIVLALLENKVLQNKLSMINYFGAKVGGQTFYFDQLRTYSIPKKEKVPDGSDYESHILLCFHPGELDLSFEVDGELIPTEFGVGKYKTKMSANKDSYRVKAVVKDPQFNSTKEYEGGFIYDSDWWHR